MDGVRICCHRGFSEEASHQGMRSTEENFLWRQRLASDAAMKSRTQDKKSLGRQVTMVAEVKDLHSNNAD